MAGFPGLEVGVDGTAYIDPESMDRTMAAIAALGARRQLVLPEREELPDDAFTLLDTTAARYGIVLHFLPVSDFSVPGDETLHQWNALRPELQDGFDMGDTLAVACQYGAGRSGLFTAMMLVERGMTPPQAIARVRRAFCEAIENTAQESWLSDYAEKIGK